MDIQRLRDMLEGVKNEAVSVEAALDALKDLPYHDMGFAKLDTHRHLRTGVPEVIFCQGKTVEQVAAIAQRLAQDHRNILATRANREMFERVRAATGDAEHHELARVMVVKP